MTWNQLRRLEQVSFFIAVSSDIFSHYIFLFIWLQNKQVQKLTKIDLKPFKSIFYPKFTVGLYKNYITLLSEKYIAAHSDHGIGFLRKQRQIFSNKAQSIMFGINNRKQ